MRKKYNHAMTIRMTDKVMEMVNQQSEALGISKNQVIQIILKEVASSYDKKGKR